MMVHSRETCLSFSSDTVIDTVIDATPLHRPLRDTGLVNNHAYSILEVRELGNVQPGVQTTIGDFAHWIATTDVSIA